MASARLYPSIKLSCHPAKIDAAEHEKALDGLEVLVVVTVGTRYNAKKIWQVLAAEVG